MTSFAYYRLPYKHHCTYIEQANAPEVLNSVAELNGKEGFVFAPFSPSESCPILLMHPDKTKFLAIQESQAPTNEGVTTEQKERYEQNFVAFHEKLQQQDFRKIVLARTAQVTLSSPQQAEALFMKACSLYPRLFVALVSTPLSGTWLMATPEILLKGKNQEYSTMSLAGTQKAKPSHTIADYPVGGIEWSEKNQEEQQYVTDYIENCIKAFTSEYCLKGPYTTMAANLYHIRTDILFHLPNQERLGDLLDALYPTPAVCGIPKEETRRFILSHENIERKYYSGFVGLISPFNDTELYVSLRCMNILSDGTYQLYAGGGLLAESEMEKEWNETDAKLQTMKKVLGDNIP